MMINRLHDQPPLCWAHGKGSVWLERHGEYRCDAVAVMARGTAAPFPKVLSGEKLGWKLDEAFFSNDGCIHRNRIKWLTPDPGRRRLLFFICQEADVTWDLYEFSLATGALNKLARGFDPIDLDVDPAGGRAIISGDRYYQCGLWSVDSGHARASKIASGCFSSIALSPDRSHIAAVKTVGHKDSVVSIPYPG